MISFQNSDTANRISIPLMIGCTRINVYRIVMMTKGFISVGISRSPEIAGIRLMIELCRTQIIRSTPNKVKRV